jgi:hypothetical protein
VKNAQVKIVWGKGKEEGSLVVRSEMFLVDGGVAGMGDGEESEFEWV